MSKILQTFIEADYALKNTETETKNKKKEFNELIHECKENLIKELERHGGEDVLQNYVLQLEPQTDDPDAKPVFLRLREANRGGNVTIRNVSETIFGREEDRVNPDIDLMHAWQTKLDTSYLSLLEKEKKQKEKEAERAAKKKKMMEKRRRTVAQIKKIREKRNEPSVEEQTTKRQKH